MSVMHKQIVCLLIMSAALIQASAATAQDDYYSLGVEGFYDNYKEPDATVNSKAEYGSVTGSYAHNWDAFFAALDGRVSYGQDKYSSVDGTVSGVPQWEFELRPRAGLTLPAAGGYFSPYTGVGMRYYMDEFKGYTTTDANGNTYGGYDRRILQFYIPIGASYSYEFSEGWSVVPNLEYDQFIWGQVSSRLGTLGAPYINTINDQSSGWGVRGSLMFGHQEGDWSWQVGPFARYWNIQASDISDDGAGYGEEPPNTRLQVGLSARVLW